MMRNWEIKVSYSFDCEGFCLLKCHAETFGSYLTTFPRILPRPSSEKKIASYS